jgi:hypothetical protein
MEVPWGHGGGAQNHQQQGARSVQQAQGLWRAPSIGPGGFGGGGRQERQYNVHDMKRFAGGLRA